MPIEYSPSAIDFSSLEFLADPYPYYALMRDGAPILHRLALAWQSGFRYH